MNLLEHIHARYVHQRRVQRLAGHLADLIPPRASVLDVGSGDGWLASLVSQRRPDIALEGVDVLIRPTTHIRVTQFDGRTFPYATGSFDVVMLVDTLHHAEAPRELLCEAARVTRHALLVKDHLLEGLLAAPTLRLMDRIGNVRHGISCPGHYWTTQQWHEMVRELGLKITVWVTRLGLYPWPASLVFDRSLHVLAKLEVLSPSRKHQHLPSS